MTKHFYCATTNQTAAEADMNYRLLQAACETAGVKFVPLFLPASAYGIDDIPILKPGGLYRLTARDKRLSQYLYAIRRKNPGMKSWFDTSSTSVGGGGIPWHYGIYAELHGLPVLPSLYGLSGVVDEALIQKVNDKLGGFPVILKQSGGSHGSGVMVLDSPESLKTVVGHVVPKGKGAQYALRKFIRQARHFRVVVIDGQAVSAIEYGLPRNDIRTNVSDDPAVKPAELTEKLAAMAVQATRNSGVLYGGVDILVEPGGAAYIAEVNTPCNFSRNQLCTGEDLAGQIVRFLCEETV